MARRDVALPTGAVTFLLTDVEGSTVGMERDARSMVDQIARQREIISSEAHAHDGALPPDQGEGDSVVAVFALPQDALACALSSQLALANETSVKVRMAVHTGQAELRDGNYLGLAVNRCARIRSLAHGGQVLVSSATAELVRDGLPSDVSLVDLGTYHLKDLSRPETVFQLCHPGLPTDLGPLRGPELRPGNLPREMTTFVGRERELREIVDLLARGAALVTLTAPGGCGKTRLSLRVAGELWSTLPDGAWFVDLASIADETFVPHKVAETFRLPEAEGRATMELLVAALAHREAVVVMDNCEHVLATASNVCRSLLEGCPRLRILVTSREPLGIAGERLYPLEPLEPASAAMRLFEERARAVQPGFVLDGSNTRTVADLCRRLDGLPLAIELAASRLQAFGPRQMLRLLEERSGFLASGPRSAYERHRSLEAAIGWSFDLLSSEEQALFGRLAVFAGAVPLEVVEEVAEGDGISRHDIADLLAALVAKSLVVTESYGDDVRYRLLETIRSYASERLVESADPDRYRRRHLGYFLGLAEQAAPLLRTPEQGRWLTALTDVHDDLRAALAWATDPVGDREGALRLATALGRFWLVRGYWTEGRTRLERALSPSTSADALLAMGELARSLGDHGGARRAYEDALEMARTSGDDRAAARCMHGLGRSASETTQDADVARTFYLQARELAAGAHDDATLGDILNGLGWLAWRESDYATSRGFHEQALEVLRRCGDGAGISETFVALAWHAFDRDDDRSGAAMSEEGLAVAEGLGLHQLAARHLRMLGNRALHENDLTRAMADLEKALKIARDLGDIYTSILSLMDLANCRATAGDHRAGTTCLQEALALATTVDNGVFASAIRQGLGGADFMLGDAARAGTWYDVAIADARRAGNAVLEATGLAALAVVHLDLGDVEAGRGASTACSALVEGLPAWVRVYALWAAAEVARADGDLEAARRLVDDAVEINPTQRHYRDGSLFKSLLMRARFACEQGDLATARASKAGCIELKRGRTMEVSTIELLDVLAQISVLEGRSDAGARLLGAADTHRDAMGVVGVRGSHRLEHERCIAAIRQALGDARFRVLFDEGARRAAHWEALLEDAAEPGTGGLVLRRDGEFWSVAFNGTEFRLKDSKGLRYIATLLARPHAEVHALDLARGEGYAGAAASTDTILAPAARDAYRRRVEDLREEVEEAHAFDDHARAERAQAELDAIASELSRAVGLHGRDRGFATEAERARQSVQRAIRSAFVRIGASSPTLALHLERTIRTGVFCAYAPAPEEAVQIHL